MFNITVSHKMFKFPRDFEEKIIFWKKKIWLLPFDINVYPVGIAFPIKADVIRLDYVLRKCPHLAPFFFAI